MIHIGTKTTISNIWRVVCYFQHIDITRSNFYDAIKDPVAATKKNQLKRGNSFKTLALFFPVWRKPFGC